MRNTLPFTIHIVRSLLARVPQREMLLMVPLVAAAAACGAVVLDRLAVVVGKHVIKTSDIDRDLRVTEFLNRQPLDLSSKARRQAAERLIDQEVIRQEIVTGDYRRPQESEALALEQQILNERYSGSETQLRQGLARDGLTEEQLRAALWWQITVLQFIEQRFRPGVYVTDQEVRAYYDQHLPEIRKQNPANSSFDAVKDQIRTLVEGEQINKNFEDWLDQARKREQVEYKQEAFQ